MLAIPDLPDESKPWAPQPWDTTFAFRQFTRYLKLRPPRQLASLTHPGLDLNTVRTLAADGLWVVRAEAWDTRQTTWQERKQRLAEALLDAAQAEVDRLNAVETTIPGLLPARDVERFARTAQALVGEEAPQAAPEAPDLSGLELEEIRTLRYLHSKAGPAKKI